MPKIVITQRAKEDIKGILRNVGEYSGSETTIVKLRNEFLEKFELISLLPKAAKIQPDGNRHLFCRRYRIVYREVGDEIYVLTVVHSLKKYP